MNKTILSQRFDKIPRFWMEKVDQKLIQSRLSQNFSPGRLDCMSLVSIKTKRFLYMLPVSSSSVEWQTF